MGEVGREAGSGGGERGACTIFWPGFYLSSPFSSADWGLRPAARGRRLGGSADSPTGGVGGDWRVRTPRALRAPSASSLEPRTPSGHARLLADRPAGSSRELRWKGMTTPITPPCPTTDSSRFSAPSSCPCGPRPTSKTPSCATKPHARRRAHASTSPRLQRGSSRADKARVFGIARGEAAEAAAAVEIAALSGDTSAEHAQRCVALASEVYALLSGLMR